MYQINKSIYGQITTVAICLSLSDAKLITKLLCNETNMNDAYYYKEM